jgi:hypothetical protein
MSQGEYVMVRTAGLEGMGDRLERIAAALEQQVALYQKASDALEAAMDQLSPYMQLMGASMLTKAGNHGAKTDNKVDNKVDAKVDTKVDNEVADEDQDSIEDTAGLEPPISDGKVLDAWRSLAVPSVATPSVATPSAAVPVPSARVSGTRPPSNTPEAPEAKSKGKVKAPDAKSKAPEAKPDFRPEVSKGRRVIRARKAPVFRQVSESVSVAPSEEDDEGFVVRLAKD